MEYESDNQPPAYSPVCMIYSEMDLATIEEVFNQNCQDGSCHYGALRVVRARAESGEWYQTNRTIALVDQTLFDALVNEGLYKSPRSKGRQNIDFRIVPYEIRDNNLPKDGFKKDLFIRLPTSVGVSVQEVEEIVHDKMSQLVKFGVVDSSQYGIKIPLKNKDRNSGEAYDSCFLTFSESVTPQTAALVKAVIDDTYWGARTETFHCFWAREQKPKSKPYFKTEASEDEQKEWKKKEQKKKPFYKGGYNPDQPKSVGNKKN